MKFGALFAAILVFLSALALAMPNSAEAARMGGGKSFGSKPFMSTPAAPPAAARRPAATAPQAGQAAQKPGMFGGMGGLFGGLLAGTLLGSLLSGNGFGGGGFMDIILLAILAFIAWKLFTRFRNRQAPAAAQAGSGLGGLFGGAAGQPQQPQPMQRADAGASGWDTLRGGGASSGPSAYVDQNIGPIPPDFNVDEFLRGAKMAYNRMQKAWDRRDLNDIAQFATPAVMDELKQQLAQDPNPGNTEIMLVNAQLVGFEQDGADERAEVYFDVLMREDPNQQTPNQAREIWHFVRHGQDGEWKLDGIQQVE